MKPAIDFYFDFYSPYGYLAAQKIDALAAKHGRVMINALTGGSHSSNSNHYRGTAVDLDLSTGNAGQLAAIARRYGGIRNSETTHIHLDF